MSVGRRGLCPGVSVRGSPSRGGGLCPGGLCLGGVSVWGSLSGGLCLEGLCLGVSVQESLSRRETPSLAVNRQTGVKTLPLRKIVGGR